VRKIAGTDTRTIKIVKSSKFRVLLRTYFMDGPYCKNKFRETLTHPTAKICTLKVTLFHMEILK